MLDEGGGRGAFIEHLLYTRRNIWHFVYCLTDFCLLDVGIIVIAFVFLTRGIEAGETKHLAQGHTAGGSMWAPASAVATTIL